MPPPPFWPFNPFAVPNLDQGQLQNMGWGVWPNQEAQQPFGDFQQ
jgi:hypothetical protein